MKNKRFNAHLYMESKIKYIHNEPIILKSENGYLYAHGRYPTKILKQELPDWYIYCYIYHRYGYISANGVKELRYVPNYVFYNHLHKDDVLYVSYGGKINCQPGTPFNLYTGYDEFLSGPCIVSFTEAVSQYSGYDVSGILAEMDAKKQWYEERNPADDSE